MMKVHSPKDSLVAGMIDDHLDSQCIVHVDEEGVHVSAVESSHVDLCNGINIRREIGVLATWHGRSL